MPTRTFYEYIWRISRTLQIRVVALTAVVVPLTMAPLELQRRVVDLATGGGGLDAIAGLCVLYLAILLVQGGLKYRLNLIKGRIVEDVTRRVREQICDWLAREPREQRLGVPDRGTTVSMVAAESEDIGGFAAEAFSTPLLQGGTTLAVLGYLLWVEPLIAVFSLAIYLPQAIVVPRIQHRINDYALAHARIVRRLGDRIVRHGDVAQEAFDPRAGLQPLIDQAYDTRMQVYRRKYFLTFLGNFLDALGPLLVVLIGGILVMQQHAEVSTLVVFISGYQKLSVPWDELINFYRSASNAIVKYGLIADTLAAGAPAGR
jgi:ABC-type multidrug transport system fused ATPase/permease subunit